MCTLIVRHYKYINIFITVFFVLSLLIFIAKTSLLGSFNLFTNYNENILTVIDLSRKIICSLENNF